MSMSKIKYILIFIVPVLITTGLLGTTSIQTTPTEISCQQKLDNLFNESANHERSLQNKHIIVEGKIDDIRYINGLSDINKHYQAFLYELLSSKKINNPETLKNFLESKLNTVAVMNTFNHFIDYLGSDKLLQINHGQQKDDQVLDDFFSIEEEKCKASIATHSRPAQCRNDFLPKISIPIKVFYDLYRQSATDPQKRKTDLALYKKVLNRHLPNHDWKPEEKDDLSNAQYYRFRRFANFAKKNSDTYKSAFVESRYGNLSLLSKYRSKPKDQELSKAIQANYATAQAKHNAINNPDKMLN